MLRPPFGPDDRKFIRRQLFINVSVYLFISFAALVFGSNLIFKTPISDFAQSLAIASKSAQAGR
jgi:hypothetical protein